MAVENYRLGVVVSQCGLSDHQMLHLSTKVEEAMCVVAGLRIKLPSFGVRDPESTLDRTVINLARRFQDHGVVIDLGPFTGKANEQVAEWLLDCDEVVGYSSKGSKPYKPDRIWAVSAYFQALPRSPRMSIISYRPLEIDPNVPLPIRRNTA